jgi:hypothetical protein
MDQLELLNFGWRHAGARSPNEDRSRSTGAAPIPAFVNTKAPLRPLVAQRLEPAVLRVDRHGQRISDILRQFANS